MDLDKATSIEIINFLKKNYQYNQNKIVDGMESDDNGIYFIDDKKVSFTNQAKNLLNIKEEMTLDLFYNRINLQDRVKLFDLLDSKNEEDKPYQIIYRYALNDKTQIWIKEHGIFSYKNKRQRVAFITNYTSQIEQDKELQRLAYYDAITGLKNQNYFNQDIKFLVKYKVPFALFSFDINSSKVFNEHMNGDNIIKQFSKRLDESFTVDYDLYRLSGNEFSLIFPYVKTTKATTQILDKISCAFANPFFLKNYNIIIKPNIGIVFYPKDSKQVPTLLKYADISRYRAKNDIMIHYSYFNRSYYKAIVEERRIEEHIDALINKEQIQLRYQPIYDIHKNQIVGLEALFCTNSIYNVEKIFQIALKSHIIVSLEQAILKKIIQDIMKYQNLKEKIRFMINITPKTLEHIDLYQEIKELLEKNHLDGSCLGIEITEQYFVDDETKLNKLIDKLHSLGIKIYLDDFGMGYSSVRNLAYISYDHIKLDKRIISTIFSNQKCAFFMNSILQFSKEAGSEIIIEGVETKEQLDYIQDIGGAYVQGYYLSKPLELENAIRLITDK